MKHLARTSLGIKALLALALLLSGCSVNQLTNHSDVNAITKWEASGKVAIFQGSQRQSVQFNWQTKPDEQALTLSTFLGIEVANLMQTADGASLTVGSNRYEGGSASELLQTHAGIDLPFEVLVDLARGVVPATGTVLRSEQGKVLESTLPINNEMWQIRYSSYGLFQGLSLPTAIMMQTQHVRVKFQINNWVIYQ